MLNVLIGFLEMFAFAPTVHNFQGNSNFAKVKFGSEVVDMRGKIGGHVYSRNRGGAYKRTKVTPTNPQTTFQSAVRNRLAAQSQAWSGLTAAQRAAWNAAVNDWTRTDVFGDSLVPSGKNLYTRLNNNLQSVGEVVITSPPLAVAVEQVIAGAFIMTNGGAKTIAYTGTTGASNIQIWATPGLSAGTNNPGTKYRLLESIDGAAVSPADISSSYEARFGEPAVGQKVFCKLVVITDGTGQNGVASSAVTIAV